jgi:hypothetical protein
MKSPLKPPKGMPASKQAPVAGRTMTDPKKQGSDISHRDRGKSDTVQLRQADKMLTRIERKGEALSASADRLLRRVS